jgi:hypothetical protein
VAFRVRCDPLTFAVVVVVLLVVAALAKVDPVVALRAE